MAPTLKGKCEVFVVSVPKKGMQNLLHDVQSMLALRGNVEELTLREGLDFKHVLSRQA